MNPGIRSLCNSRRLRRDCPCPQPTAYSLPPTYHLQLVAHLSALCCCTHRRTQITTFPPTDTWNKLRCVWDACGQRGFHVREHQGLVTYIYPMQAEPTTTSLSTTGIAQQRNTMVSPLPRRPTTRCPRRDIHINHAHADSQRRSLQHLLRCTIPPTLSRPHRHQLQPLLQRHSAVQFPFQRTDFSHAADHPRERTTHVR